VNRHYDDIENLIGKYFAGETSSEENAVVEAWRNENATNQKQFDQYRTIFTKASTVRSDQQFDTDAAWSKLKNRLHVKNTSKVARMRPEVAISKAFLRLAASIVILITVGFFTYRLIFPERDRMQLASGKSILRDTLPDGTNVVVNKQSKVSYAFNSRRKQHVVKLSGEAYFTVNSRKNKTFIVEAEGLLIRDIGTSFNVKAYPNTDSIEVFVEEGEVRFYSEDNDGVNLSAGTKGVYNKSTKKFSTRQARPDIVSYKSRFFVFTDQSLGEVVQLINDAYEKQIVISDSLKNCRLTVTFNNEDIAEIASVIAETLGLTVQPSDTQIKLEGKGCE
jgi:transmembrane sensor